MRDIYELYPRPWRVSGDSDGYPAVMSHDGRRVVTFCGAFRDCGSTEPQVLQAICDAVNAANDEGADAHRPADELDHAVMEHVALEPLRKALASIIKGLTKPETPDATVPPETRNHDNTAMLARRVGELEREVETLRAALRSARLIFDGVGDD